jgi:hypothetical protein
MKKATLAAGAGVLVIAGAVWLLVATLRTPGKDPLPAPGPSLRDSKPALRLAGPGHAEKSLDEANEVSANARGEVLARHDDPVRLVKSYHQAVDRGDMEAVTECYMPERRAAVGGMLGVVPRKIDWQKLGYEIAEQSGDLAFVRVTGSDVNVDGRRLKIDERVKVRKVRGHWYLDDL